VIPGGPPRQENPWHALRAEEAVAALDTDRLHGLSSAEAVARRERFGANALPERRRSSLAAVFLRQFESPLIYLLLVAAGIAVAVGETSDAVVIFVVVLLNAVIGALQEGRAQRSLEALRRLTGHTGRVLRGGQEQVIAARDVVPGDILLLSAGDAVSADARIIGGAALQIAEAALTGESLPVAKHARVLEDDTPLADRRNMVFAGTHVTAGRARAVVVATGLATEVGHIAALASGAQEPQTPLERRIDQFGRHVIVAGGAVFVLVIGLGLLRGMPFAHMFMIGVSTLVGMIPEGLPVAMTIALAVGVQRMARRRALVRRLSAVETLGSTTVICTDKTGTLTRNEMTVISVHLPPGRAVSVSGAGYAPEGRLLETDGRVLRAGDDEALRCLLEAAVLCNDAQLHGPGPDDPRWMPVGDPTEVALLTAARKAGIDPVDVRARFARRAEIPFDADAQMMATQHESPDGAFVVVKGAPEVVVGLCDASAGPATALRAAEAMAARALRVLAVALVPRAVIDAGAGLAAFRGRATLLGLLGQIDPPRTEAALAVARCQAAGIRPVMVTGDHKATGLAIARTLGIAREGDRVVDGPELDGMSDAELADGIEAISVFARVHPAQKLRIVEAYQARGEVVAMTGDGVNDAPALVKADVGVAMGITGTEVAKDAAKVVIADDDFATIVAAVEEGRVVYRNIKKAILLLFSTGSAEIAVLVLAMLLGYPPPFAAVQILWNNLVTEGVIVVNLIMEPAEGDEMRQRPIATDEPLLTRSLLARMALMTPAITVSTIGWFVARTAAGLPEAQVRTETFTLLAVCEWFNVLNCRSASRSALSLGLLRNPWLLGGLVVGNLLQVAVVFWAPLGRVLHTVPFDLHTALLLGVVGSLVLWVEEARKLLARRRGPTPPA
jgi:Ca2+-transporting ATPase